MHFRRLPRPALTLAREGGAAISDIVSTPQPRAPLSPRLTLLSIAGWDPTAGAGAAADLKVFEAHGFAGTAALSALTVQNTLGVHGVHPLEPGLLAQTLAELAVDLPPAGIKVGMLATAPVVRVVLDFLGTLPRSIPVVLDPVLASSSGHPLLSPEGLALLKNELLPLATVATPNTQELALLTGHAAPIATHAQTEAAAHALLAHHPRLALVVTGGHLHEAEDPTLTDLLLRPHHAPEWITGPRIQTPATHGTGCAFSSALLCALVAGLALSEAVRAAKAYVAQALGAAIPQGRGGGSMHHLFPLTPRPALPSDPGTPTRVS